MACDRNFGTFCDQMLDHSPEVVQQLGDGDRQRAKMVLRDLVDAGQGDALQRVEQRAQATQAYRAEAQGADPARKRELLAARRQQLAEQAAVDSQAADDCAELFREFAHYRGDDGQPLRPPSHSQVDPRTGVPLPKADMIHGYAVAMRAIRAAREGQLTPEAERRIAVRAQRETAAARRQTSQRTRRLTSTAEVATNGTAPDAEPAHGAAALREPRVVMGPDFDAGGYFRCQNCGQFASPVRQHLCRQAASAGQMLRFLKRRLAVPLTAYDSILITDLIDQARTDPRGLVAMTHGLTGAQVLTTLDGVLVALQQGYVPESWQGLDTLAPAATPDGRVVPVTDVTGLRPAPRLGTVYAQAAQASGVLLDAGQVIDIAGVAPAAARPALVATNGATTVRGGQVYDANRFVGTEYRRRSGIGQPVAACGVTYTVGERSLDPRDWSSARATNGGRVADPPATGRFAGVAAGRTLLAAVEVLRTAQVVEAEGRIEVYAPDGSALLAVYDPAAGVAGGTRRDDLDADSPCTAVQMAAVLAYAARHGRGELADALRRDLAAAHDGAGSALAAADSAYIVIRRRLETGAPLHFGGDVGTPQCEGCGQFMGSNHVCPSWREQPVERAEVAAAAQTLVSEWPQVAAAAALVLEDRATHTETAWHAAVATLERIAPALGRSQEGFGIAAARRDRLAAHAATYMLEQRTLLPALPPDASAADQTLRDELREVGNLVRLRNLARAVRAVAAAGERPQLPPPPMLAGAPSLDQIARSPAIRALAERTEATRYADLPLSARQALWEARQVVRDETLADSRPELAGVRAAVRALGNEASRRRPGVTQARAVAQALVAYAAATGDTSPAAELPPNPEREAVAALEHEPIAVAARRLGDTAPALLELADGRIAPDADHAPLLLEAARQLADAPDGDAAARNAAAVCRRELEAGVGAAGLTTDQMAAMRSLAGVLAERSGQQRCPECQQFMPAQGGHTCPPRVQRIAQVAFAESWSLMERASQPHVRGPLHEDEIRAIEGAAQALIATAGAPDSDVPMALVASAREVLVLRDAAPDDFTRRAAVTRLAEELAPRHGGMLGSRAANVRALRGVNEANRLGLDERELAGDLALLPAAVVSQVARRVGHPYDPHVRQEGLRAGLRLEAWRERVDTPTLLQSQGLSERVVRELESLPSPAVREVIREADDRAAGVGRRLQNRQAWVTTVLRRRQRAIEAPARLRGSMRSVVVDIANEPLSDLPLPDVAEAHLNTVARHIVDAPTGSFDDRVRGLATAVMNDRGQDAPRAHRARRELAQAAAATTCARCPTCQQFVSPQGDHSCPGAQPAPQGTPLWREWAGRVGADAALIGVANGQFARYQDIPDHARRTLLRAGIHALAVANGAVPETLRTAAHQATDPQTCTIDTMIALARGLAVAGGASRCDACGEFTAAGGAHRCRRRGEDRDRPPLLAPDELGLLAQQPWMHGDALPAEVRGLLQRAADMIRVSPDAFPGALVAVADAFTSAWPDERTTIWAFVDAVQLHHQIPAARTLAERLGPPLHTAVEVAAAGQPVARSAELDQTLWAAMHAVLDSDPGTYPEHLVGAAQTYQREGHNDTGLRQFLLALGAADAASTAPTPGPSDMLLRRAGLSEDLIPYYRDMDAAIVHTILSNHGYGPAGLAGVADARGFARSALTEDAHTGAVILALANGEAVPAGVRVRAGLAAFARSIAANGPRVSPTFAALVSAEAGRMASARDEVETQTAARELAWMAVAASGQARCATCGQFTSPMGGHECRRPGETLDDPADASLADITDSGRFFPYYGTVEGRAALGTARLFVAGADEDGPAHLGMAPAVSAGGFPSGARAQVTPVTYDDAESGAQGVQLVDRQGRVWLTLATMEVDTQIDDVGAISEVVPLVDAVAPAEAPLAPAPTWREGVDPALCARAAEELRLDGAEIAAVANWGRAGVRSGGAERVLGDLARAIAVGERSGFAPQPSRVVILASNYLSALGGRDRDEVDRATQAWAETVAQMGGAPRCPDCGEYTSPTVGHLCPSAQRTIAGAGLDIGARTLDTTPSLLRVARGERPYGTGASGYAEARALGEAAATIGAAVARGLPVPEDLRAAADAFATAPANESGRILAAALAGIDRPVAGETPPQVVPEALAANLSPQVRHMAQQDCAALGDELVRLANRQVRAPREMARERLAAWARMVAEAGASGGVAPAMDDAARAWQERGDSTALAAMICEMGGAARCTTCQQFVSAQGGHVCPGASQTPAPRAYVSVAQQALAAWPVLRAVPWPETLPPDVEQAIDQAAWTITQLPDGAAPQVLRHFARLVQEGAGRRQRNAFTQALIDAADAPGAPATGQRGPQTQALNDTITRSLDRITMIADGEPWETVADSIAAQLDALPAAAVPAALRTAVAGYREDRDIGAVARLRTALRHAQGQIRAGTWDADAAVADAALETPNAAEAPEPAPQGGDDWAAQLDAPVRRRAEQMLQPAVLAVANGGAHIPAVGHLQQFVEATDAAGLPTPLAGAMAGFQRAWTAGQPAADEIRTLAQAICVAGGASRCPACQQFTSPAAPHDCPARAQAAPPAGAASAAPAPAVWAQSRYRYASALYAAADPAADVGGPMLWRTANTVALTLAENALEVGGVPEAVRQAARDVVLTRRRRHDNAGRRDATRAFARAMRDAAYPTPQAVVRDVVRAPTQRAQALIRYANGDELDTGDATRLRTLLRDDLGVLRHDSRQPEALRQALDAFTAAGVLTDSPAARALARELLLAAGADRCPRCQQFTSAATPHTCPAGTAPDPTSAPVTFDLATATDYDVGRFAGTEYRRRSARGLVVETCGRTFVAGQHATDPRDASRARRSGREAMPAGGVVVGRLLPAAVDLLRTARVVETPGGGIELHSHSGGLISAFDPATRTAAVAPGATSPYAALNADSDATVEQMAAWVAWLARHEDHDGDLQSDLRAAHDGTGSPLAAADSAYLLTTRYLERGGALRLGGRLQTARCPTCGEFMGTSHVCPQRAQPAAFDPAVGGVNPATGVYELPTDPYAPVAPPGALAQERERVRERQEAEALLRLTVELMNTASRAELMGLPGIGPVLADRIIAARNQRPFTGLHDLYRARLGGQRRQGVLAALQNRVTLGSAARARTAVQRDLARESTAADTAQEEALARRATAEAGEPAHYADDMAAFQADYDAALARQRRGDAGIPYLTENATGGLGARDGGRGFGVEIEFAGGDLTAIGRELYAAGLTRQARIEGYHASQRQNDGKWGFERDGSVSGEIVSPVMYDEPRYWEELAQVCEIVKRNGGRVTTSVGGHVHVGCGNFDHTPERHARLTNLVAKESDLMYRLATNPHRADGEHRGDSYCSPMAEVSQPYQNVSDAYSNQGGRYKALNWQSVSGRVSDHVEFRLWDGSLDPAVIQTQLKISLAMTEAAYRMTNEEITAVPLQNRGTHLRQNPTEALLEGEQWTQQSRRFREFADRLFTRREDKAQLTALFAATRWQTGNGQYRQITRKPARRDREAVRRERQRLIAERERQAAEQASRRTQVAVADSASLSRGQAEQIAQLVQQGGQLRRSVTAAEVQQAPARYVVLADGNGDVAAVARTESAQWYQADLSQLTLADGRDRALRGQVIQLAEERAISQGARLLQTTVRTSDQVSRRALREAGWEPRSAFHNARSGQNVEVWQRTMAPATPPRPLPVVRPRPAQPAPSSVTMTTGAGTAMGDPQAAQIATLLNTRNRLGAEYTPERVRAGAGQFTAATDAGGNVIGVAETRRINWYQHEIRHVSVAEGHERQGHGERLVQQAMTQAQSGGARVVQATISADNDASRRLFARMGFTRTTSFHNPESGNDVEVWQRSLVPTQPEPSSNGNGVHGYDDAADDLAIGATREQAMR